MDYIGAFGLAFVLVCFFYILPCHFIDIVKEWKERMKDEEES